MTKKEFKTIWRVKAKQNKSKTKQTKQLYVCILNSMKTVFPHIGSYLFGFSLQELCWIVLFLMKHHQHSLPGLQTRFGKYPFPLWLTWSLSMRGTHKGFGREDRAEVILLGRLPRTDAAASGPHLRAPRSPSR